MFVIHDEVDGWLETPSSTLLLTFRIDQKPTMRVTVFNGTRSMFSRWLGSFFNSHFLNFCSRGGDIYQRYFTLNFWSCDSTGGGQTVQGLPKHHSAHFIAREQGHETPTLDDAHEGHR